MIHVILAEGDQAMEAVGAAIGRAMQARGVIYLQGDLGAGKTTLSRGLIRAQGHSGAVKSPTFTLVEPYELNGSAIYHFDLYRLLDPEELEFLGVRDYFSPDSLCLVEWPDKGLGVLPSPDMTITIDTTQTGRRLEVEGHSEHGRTACRQLQTRDDAKT